MRRLAALALVLAGCGGTNAPGTDVPFVLVTLSTRATVRPLASLHVSFSNAGTTVSQDFSVSADAPTFPKTLTVTAPGRTGELALEVTALDGDGAVVARGAGQVTLADGEVDLGVMLDPEDFVVNAGVLASQELAGNPDLAGRQLAARADGSAMIAWERACVSASCDVYLRRLGADGLPLASGMSPAGSDLVADRFVQVARDPAIAGSPAGYLVTWASGASASDPDFDVRASLLDGNGSFVLADFAISTDPAQEASAMPFALADGSFVVVWARARTDGAADLLARHVNTDGSESAAILVVSAAEPGGHSRPHGIGLAGGNFVVVWSHLDPASGSVNAHARVFQPSGATVGPEYLFSTYPSGQATGVRAVATADGGFVVAWQAFDPNDAALLTRPLVLRVVDGAGNVSPERRVAEATTTTPQVVPALAVRASDGAIAVAWGDDGTNGDGNRLGVRLRLLHKDGTACSDAIVVNTTTLADQFEASLAASADDGFLVSWTDSSQAAPDTDGSGVRARYVYPARCE